MSVEGHLFKRLAHERIQQDTDRALDKVMRPPTSDTAPRTAAATDHVMTPQGPGRIIHTQAHTYWVFGRPRRRIVHIIEYPNGHRHAWVPDKVKPL